MKSSREITIPLLKAFCFSRTKAVEEGGRLKDGAKETPDKLQFATKCEA